MPYIFKNFTEIALHCSTVIKIEINLPKSFDPQSTRHMPYPMIAETYLQIAGALRCK